MLCRALDMALCIRGTRAADHWLMTRLEPQEALAYKLRRTLIQRITHEDPLVLRLASLLAGGAGEYTPLIRRVVELHG